MVVDPELIDTEIKVATRDVIGLPLETDPKLLESIITTK